MFSLLESSAPRRCRGLATLLSFGFQVAAVGLLVLLPLFYTQALPNLVRSVIELPVPPRPAAPQQVRPQRGSTSQSEVSGETVVQPIHIPDHMPIIHDEQPLEPTPAPGSVTIPGGIGSASDWRRSPLSEIVGASVPPIPAPSTATRVKISELSQGYLLHQVKPIYPAPARTARVQGTVVLDALISRAGAIENLRVLSGHPLLIPAALEAVRQWRYRPYLLNGTPVEVETQITINFTLASGG